MFQNIKNNYHSNYKIRPYNNEYYDFTLYGGNIYEETNLQNKLIVDIDYQSINNNTLYSHNEWHKAINEGVELMDIGLTAMDNGFIKYRKDRISNKEFLNLLVNSTLSIDSDDKRFFMTLVDGNTQDYLYPVEYNDNEKYISFKGGFYQGFFKINGNCYEVLPSNIEEELNINISLRPRNDYTVKETTINDLRPNNKGFFFYIGTRAENKFYPFYNVSEDSLNRLVKEHTSNDGYSIDNNFAHNNVVNEQYMGETGYEPDICDNFFIDDYLKGNAEMVCTCNSYFIDDYFGECNDTGNYLPSDYVEEEVEINVDNIYDSEGRNYNKKGYYEIKTDNKFILFNRTETGFTVNNWDRTNEEVVLTGRTDWDNYNYHILMNRTETGHTVNTIKKFNENNRKSYNIYKDIVNNALGFRIKEDGSIGYRYATVDCEDEDKYGIVEEYSKPNVVQYNEWSKVHIKIIPIGKKMKIMIYVDGNLILISKELTKLNLRGLNDVKEKQQGVPYNISLGGGTQGLLEAIYPDYYNQPQFIMPLERDFCGSFIGDINSFKIIYGFLDNLTIKNYL